MEHFCGATALSLRAICKNLKMIVTTCDWFLSSIYQFLEVSCDIPLHVSFFTSFCSNKATARAVAGWLRTMPLKHREYMSEGIHEHGQTEGQTHVHVRAYSYIGTALASRHSGNDGHAWFILEVFQPKV